MVRERRILLRVEHFEQRRGRIAAEVHAQLVDFIQHEHRVPRARLPQALDDAARQRADVRPPVSADLRLVPHAAQRHANELPPKRARDGLPQRGLSHARRADEAEDRPFHILLELQHGKVFENAILDFRQVVVVLVEDAARLRNLQLVLRRDRPRQLRQPVEIGPHHRVFRRRRGNRAEPLLLLVGGLLHLFGHPRRADLALDFQDVALLLVLLAQLLADRLHLFAQEEFALALGKRFADLVLDLRPQPQHLQLAVQQRGQAAEPRTGPVILQQQLPVFKRHVQVRGNQVRELAGILDVEHGDLQLFRQRGGKRDDLLEPFGGIARQRRQLDGSFFLVLQHPVVRFQVMPVFLPVHEPAAADALHENADRVVREFQHLHKPREAAVFVQILERDLVVLRLAAPLERRDEHPVPADNHVNELDGFRRAHDQRRDHAGKQHDVAQRQHRQDARQLVALRRGFLRRVLGPEGFFFFCRIAHRLQSSVETVIFLDAAACARGRRIFKMPLTMCAVTWLPSTGKGSETVRWKGPYSISIWRKR
ncbi:MAG: hypothetical protein BWY59_00701 [Verrucomicrobia bacterium ADurb.Bin345]|nr:MAG: hypothetical protein BWY59_00701 [Verrucomicrobia bacterium ADurb.Bin345]